MNRLGTSYADSTIRTMATSRMFMNSPVHATTTYSDLERVGRGRYRLV